MCQLVSTESQASVIPVHLDSFSSDLLTEGGLQNLQLRLYFLHCLGKFLWTIGSKVLLLQIFYN